MSVQYEVIKYNNQPFAIHHLIEDCPAHTVVRELLMNAVEAVVQMNLPGRIEWFIEKRDGVRKLGLYNEGPGMSAADLRRLMDMASTGKKLGVDDNFGQGGKVSGLKVSPAGLIYRSCKDGTVCEIMLAAEPQPNGHPIYVKRRFPVKDATGETWETVLDVTEESRGRKGRSLDRDWTEVILLGKTPDQDTVAKLLPDAVRKNWLIREINQRFYRFPKGVVIHNADASSGQQNERRAFGLEEITQRYSGQADGGQHEDVQATHPHYGPVTIRYFRLRGRWGVDSVGEARAKSMEAYGIGSRGDHICLAWKDECYEVNTGWSRISGPFGITYGSANVAIQIVLPDGAPVKNNTYRDKLLRKDDSGQHVQVTEFADLVRESRPEWLVRYIEEEAGHDRPSSNVMDRLKSFLEELTVAGQRRSRVEGEGDQEGDSAGGTGSSTGSSTGAGGNGQNNRTHSARGRRTGAAAGGPPEVRFATDPAHLEEMQGRAALYRREENLVLLNCQHFRYQQDLQRLFEDTGPDADRQQLAEQLFNEEYAVQAGKYVLQAWLFRGRAEWSDDEFEAALGMGAMTVHLATPATLAEARRRYRQRMNATRMEAAASA